MNILSREKRCQIVASLVEGNSIRATCRMTDTAKGTVLKLLRDLGTVCAECQDEHLRDLSCNLAHAVALHFMYYNFCRIHRSLRMTPAMAAGVTDHLWKIEDIVTLLEEQERAGHSN